MKKRLPRMLRIIACIGLIGTLIALIPRPTDSPSVPGLTPKDRVLLRIWMVDAPGGAPAWLKGQLRTFEKQHPGVMTYLRTVPAQALTEPDAVLPDIVLYMPGSLTDPQTLFVPLSGESTARNSPLREELLRCGRWQTQQYGLPLCWGAWVLVIDSALEPGSAATPAPTTLLGRSAATAPADASPVPGYPLDAAAQADCALQSPGGAALFTLGTLLDDRPPLPQDMGTLSPGEVYSTFQRRACATAMLTTGQMTAFSALTSAGSGFPFRIMTAEEVITDQVWLAGITADAPDCAALLLSHLTGPEAQKDLSAQGLFSARDDLTLYAAGPSARVEQAAWQSLSAINAYLPVDRVHQAAWQFFQGTQPLSDALLPLM